MSEASVAASKAIGAATDARILEVLAEHPRGLMTAEIADLTGFNPNRVNSALRRIGNGLVRGKLLEGGKGLSVISALPANAAAMHARIAEDIARRRANAKAKKAAANKRAAARRWNREVRDLSEDWGDRQPLARIVPAHLAKPLGKLGPRWVFELAA